LAYHDRVIATLVPAIGCAFEPGERAINEWCPADGAWGVLDMVKLAEEVASTIREVPGESFLVNGQQ
jgi:hypothetical protein